MWSTNVINKHTNKLNYFYMNSCQWILQWVLWMPEYVDINNLIWPTSIKDLIANLAVTQQLTKTKPIILTNKQKQKMWSTNVINKHTNKLNYFYMNSCQWILQWVLWMPEYVDINNLIWPTSIKDLIANLAVTQQPFSQIKFDQS